MRERTASSSHERIVTIAIRPQFLIEHFLTGVEVPTRLQAFVSGPRSQIDHCQISLSAEMVDITTQLLENPHTGPLGLLYTEALTHELLCTTVGTLCRSHPVHHQLRALSAARQQLTEQFVPVPTLKQLARSVGLSEKALTRGFKTMYGQTVFEFGLRCRMQHALTLLRDRNWSVDRVSEATGYSHPTSFTTAFRRYFRLRPVELKSAKAGRNTDGPRSDPA